MLRIWCRRRCSSRQEEHVATRGTDGWEFGSKWSSTFMAHARQPSTPWAAWKKAPISLENRILFAIKKHTSKHRPTLRWRAWTREKRRSHWRMCQNLPRGHPLLANACSPSHAHFLFRSNWLPSDLIHRGGNARNCNEKTRRTIVWRNHVGM